MQESKCQEKERVRICMKCDEDGDVYFSFCILNQIQVFETCQDVPDCSYYTCI